MILCGFRVHGCHGALLKTTTGIALSYRREQTRGFLRKCREEFADSGDLESRLVALDSVGKDLDAFKTYASLIRKCGDARVLSDAKRLHSHIVKRGRGYETNTFLCNLVLQMYHKCGSLDDARRCFDSMSDRNVHTWCHMISAYAKQGHRREAFDLYSRLRREKLEMNSFLFSSILAACCSPDALAEGKAIHAEVIARALHKNIILQTSLIVMYAKCGSLEDARVVFREVSDPDVIAFSAIIAAYAQQGHFELALELYSEMDSRGVVPNKRTFSSVVSACSNLGDLEFGRAVHKRIISDGIEADIVLKNSLLSMYAKCGSLNDAKWVFDGMQQRSVATWNAMISSYVQHQRDSEALSVYYGMNVEPNCITFAGVLAACSNPSTVDEGRKIHQRILTLHFQSDEVVQAGLVNMYSKGGCIDEARQVFDGIEKKNVYIWTCIINGYLQNGYPQEALEMFYKMQDEGITEPDDVTYAAALGACSSLGALEEGKAIHDRICSRGMEYSDVVSAGLVDMYGKCGQADEAKRVFDKLTKKDVVTWTALITSFSQSEEYSRAIEVYHLMDLEGVQPNRYTFARIIAACSSIGAVDVGKAVHERTVAIGLHLDEVLQDAILYLFIKYGTLEEAKGVFEKLRQRNVYVWTAMITALAQHGYEEEAIGVYREMEKSDVCDDADHVTYVGALSACANMGALEEGKEIHSRLMRRGMDGEGGIQCALVNMYAKCGCLEDAKKVFGAMSSSNRSVVAWTVIISAHSQQGLDHEAIKLFHDMDQDGVEPNNVTLSTVLSACWHAGFVRQAEAIHLRAVATGIGEDTAVRNALIKVYGRWGKLVLARDMFESTSRRNVGSWTCMISSYVQHGDAREAIDVYKRMLWEGVDASEASFASVLSACGALEDLKEGMLVHKMAIAKGLNGQVIHNSIVNMYAKCGSLEQAEEAFEKSLKSGGGGSVVCWTTMIGAYVHRGYSVEALGLFKRMELPANTVTYTNVLSACGNVGDLQQGREIHDRMKGEMVEDGVVETALVSMYSRCGSVPEARWFFDGLKRRDVVTWNAMMGAYAQLGGGDECKEVEGLYKEMVLEGIEPNGVTFISVLVACGQAGMVDECEEYFKSMVMDYGMVPWSEHYGCLVDELGRCGRLKDAEEVLLWSPNSKWDACAWMSLLGACRTHEDVYVGKRAAQHLYRIDPADPAPYSLLRQIYSSH